MLLQTEGAGDDYFYPQSAKVVSDSAETNFCSFRTNHFENALCFPPFARKLREGRGTPTVV
ncbi:MAG TPA: hypothetical protein VMU26_28250 [Candidatus Polarisedimenticolia bacterium]|nr:hypothetical protein [Candidatus Polarisedimenticolia bacterium]